MKKQAKCDFCGKRARRLTKPKREPRVNVVLGMDVQKVCSACAPRFNY